MPQRQTSDAESQKPSAGNGRRQMPSPDEIVPRPPQIPSVTQTREPVKRLYPPGTKLPNGKVVIPMMID
jgi:hypothetical protein